MIIKQIINKNNININIMVVKMDESDTIKIKASILYKFFPPV